MTRFRPLFLFLSEMPLCVFVLKYAHEGSDLFTGGFGGIAWGWTDFDFEKW